MSWNTTKMQRSEIPVGIGEKAHVQNAIIDKNARIGKNVKVKKNSEFLFSSSLSSS